jgi:hypothetical protein
MNQWIVAVILIAAGLVLGTTLSSIVRKRLKRLSEHNPLSEAADDIGNLTFWVLAGLGMLAALSLAEPDQLREIPSKLVAHSPRLLSAAIILIGGKVLGTFASIATTKAALRTSGQARPALGKGVRTAVTVAAGLLAVSQLGIDTTIIDMAVAALIFGTAATATLLVGLGARDVAGNIAAGRHARRTIEPGMTVSVGEVRGVVRTVGTVALLVQVSGGDLVQIPHSHLLEGVVRIHVASDQGPVGAEPAPTPTPRWDPPSTAG